MTTANNKKKIERAYTPKDVVSPVEHLLFLLLRLRKRLGFPLLKYGEK